MEQESSGALGRATVSARAALAGNPSDGYGGAVVAVPIPVVSATVEVRTSSAAGSGDDARADPDLDALVHATVRAAHRLTGMPSSVVDGREVRVHTSIPRSVGLAGSSAIVIAGLRALARLEPVAEWAITLSDPDALAVVARSAEVDELGIAAGLQDRLVQAHARPLLMEFDEGHTVDVMGYPCGSVSELPSPPGLLLLAHRAADATSSGAVHGGLSRRTDLGPTMRELAACARAAADAMRAGSIGLLGAAMDRTFDLRSAILELDPLHVEMVERSRSAGGRANYSGSGGAVIVLCADRTEHERVADELSSLPGCTVTRDPLADPGFGAMSHPPAWMDPVIVRPHGSP